MKPVTAVEALTALAEALAAEAAKSQAEADASESTTYSLFCSGRAGAFRDARQLAIQFAYSLHAKPPSGIGSSEDVAAFEAQLQAGVTPLRQAPRAALSPKRDILSLVSDPDRVWEEGI